MRMQKTTLLLVLSFIVLLTPIVLEAQRIGVGVTTGIIRIDDPLKPGAIYYFPSMGVINTGETGSYYTVEPSFRTDQEELRFDPSWLQFSPDRFYLEPGKSQPVRLTLALPVSGIRPGDYFALLSAQPLKVDAPGTQIGVAAATKLYFTVAPANIFQGIYYRFISLYAQHHPWNTIVLAMIFAASLIVLFRKKFDIQIAKK